MGHEQKGFAMRGISALKLLSIEAQVQNVPTSITYAINNGHRMTFWYDPATCPVCESGWHWEMFDVRWFGVEQEAWLSRVDSARELDDVKEIIADKNVFLEIANRLGIGVVDTVDPQGGE